MSQTNEIYIYLRKRKKKGITPIEALEKFGCFRLGARIYDLRKSGIEIERYWEEDNGKRFARYVLVGEPMEKAA